MLLFVAMFLTLSGRFLYIQGTGEVSGVSLKELADKRRTNTYELQAKRGTIYDRNGMALAQDRTVYRVYAIVREDYTTNPEEPRHVENPHRTAEMLAPLLNMDVTEIVSKIETAKANDLFQVEFGTNGKNLSQEKKDEIDALDLPGIEFMEDKKRFYPNGVFASQVIGLAQKKEGVIKGVTGIEQQLNDYLTGENGVISYKRDKYNVKLLNPEEVVTEADDGEDVYLTIDQKIQTLLEDSMSQVAEQYEPERMTAVVMNPKTGEVLAMSNRPSYNPNQLGEVENWYNDAISTPFEPGSTMKIFTLAAAIEEGVYQPNDTYASGSYRIDDRNRPIRDHRRGGWGTITYEEGIQRSSNVAAAKLVWEKMGPDTFRNYLNDFHFNQPTGIDLPGEQAGTILYNWPIEKITTSFGQGTTLTPIQQMMAATAIANDGKMVRPYVISKVYNQESGKNMTETEPEVVGNPISPSTANQVRNVLETVVTSENGTGKVYKLNDYTLAGKTGTAQIPDPESGGYLTGDDNYIFSFLGMAPKNNPELLMYVSVKQPKLSENELGSEPVSFIFKNVMENSLHYLNIRPDKQENSKVETIVIPNMVGQETKQAQKRLEDYGLNVTTIGDGTKVTNIHPNVGERVLSNERILLITDKPAMPDIIGWSLRDVMKFSSLLDLDIEVIGNGYVVKQHVEPGTYINEGDYLVVEFAKPNQESESTQEDESNELDPPSEGDEPSDSLE